MRFNFMKLAERLSLPVRLESLAPGRDFVRAACERGGLEGEDGFALALAVDEVLSNLVEHSGLGPDDEVEVRVELGERQVSVTVRDRGPAFDPSTSPAPDAGAPLEERPIGGLGWHLVRQVVDEIRYTSDPDEGNCLVLVRRLGGAAAPATGGRA